MHLNHDTPLVSIIIPAYNAAQYLPQAIESCLAQTYPHYEILVVNDGSTDNTPDIARDYSGVICINQENKGLAGARNTGIAHAQGTYIQFLDADDILLPEKLALCVQAFREHPTIGLVYTDYEIRSADLARNLDHLKPNLALTDDLLSTLINNTSTLFKVPCALVKSEYVRRVNGFTPGMQGVEDWHFWIKLAAEGVNFLALPETLAWYRHSENSMSKDQTLMLQSRLVAYQGLRDLALPAHIDIEEHIAGRYHHLGMHFWRQNQRARARQTLRQAWQTHSQGRILRQTLWAMSYLLNAGQAEKILAWLTQVRGR